MPISVFMLTPSSAVAMPLHCLSWLTVLGSMCNHAVTNCRTGGSATSVVTRVRTILGAAMADVGVTYRISTNKSHNNSSSNCAHNFCVLIQWYLSLSQPSPSSPSTFHAVVQAMAGVGD